jgi:hypothetical protein
LGRGSRDAAQRTPDGSMAISAFTLSGAVNAALKPKLLPWLCTTITHGQTFWTK